MIRFVSVRLRERDEEMDSNLASAIVREVGDGVLLEEPIVVLARQPRFVRLARTLIASWSAVWCLTLSSLVPLLLISNEPEQEPMPFVALTSPFEQMIESRAGGMITCL